ncbi:hypothetical protein AVEN_221276-1 [Araneus ventricosus]|uniref:Uncharacterized protein n=1 Tax=Araneus ventricosus TaxID=182803 RepID=A0A4Y2AZM4_ARAVE|nr:hypothetical protein AVEN_221276-1 [Araneus ventricosus]
MSCYFQTCRKCLSEAKQWSKNIPPSSNSNCFRTHPLNKEISASTPRMPMAVQFLSQTASVAKCRFWSQKGTRSHLHWLVIIDFAVCVRNGVGRFRSFPAPHSSEH